MGSLDDVTQRTKGLVDAVTDLAADHPDQVEDALDRISDIVDDRTGGRFTDQIDRAEDVVLDRLKDDRA